MSNENRNDQLHWTSRLSELDSLPGEVFERDTAWEKLQARLEQKPAKRNKWYWLAAASLLIAVSLPWLVTNNTPGPEAARISYSTPGVKNRVKQTPVPVTRAVTAEMLEHTIITSKPVPVVDRDNKRNLQQYTRPDMAVRIITPPVNFPPDTILAPVPATIAMNISPVKKKLTVVHLNELDGQATKNIIAGNEHGRPYFPVKFLSREVLTSNTGSGSRSRDNLITIRLSSQN
jgi:hypothetical protein